MVERQEMGRTKEVQKDSNHEVTSKCQTNRHHFLNLNNTLPPTKLLHGIVVKRIIEAYQIYQPIQRNRSEYFV